LSLKEAAALAGVSKVTLWRLVSRGVIEASLDDKKRYAIDREVFQKWKESLPETSQETDSESNAGTFNVKIETPGEAQKRFSGQLEMRAETVEMVPGDLHKLALETARNALECMRNAEDRAARAERQMESLSGQLIKYQNVLNEKAESLIEKEAYVKQAEMLASENEARLSLYEQEKHQWLSELETAKNRVNWLEKRVPRWVRGLFGAS